MARYEIDGMTEVLVTATPDSGERWNGFAIPRATFEELDTYCTEVLANGLPDGFRVRKGDGTIIVYWPCDGGDIDERGEVYFLNNGFHHHSEDDVVETVAPDGTISVGGITWQLVEDEPAQDPRATCELEPDDGLHTWVRNGDGAVAFDVMCAACGQKGRSVVTIQEVTA